MDEEMKQQRIKQTLDEIDTPPEDIDEDSDDSLKNPDYIPVVEHKKLLSDVDDEDLLDILGDDVTTYATSNDDHTPDKYFGTNGLEWNSTGSPLKRRTPDHNIIRGIPIPTPG